MSRIIEARGVDKVLDELIERLHDALAGLDRSTTVTPVRTGFNHDGADPGLLEWMPAMHDGRVIAIKTVGYHPLNPSRRGLPSVMATTSVYDTLTGRLVAVLDATLLTALRTGAASAVATDILATSGPVVLGVIGCGAQAVTQIHAISRVRPVLEVLAVDVVPEVAATLAGRVPLDCPVRVVPSERREELVDQVDVLCTCTSVAVGAGPVIGDAPHRPWLHVNAVGSDFPGKRELPRSLLEAALVCPDLVEQCLVEGECQWIDGSAVGPDLATLVKERDRHELHRARLTVFDSTGWSLEDLVAAELVLDLAAVLGVGHDVSLQRPTDDPYDPYGALR